MPITIWSSYHGEIWLPFRRNIAIYLTFIFSACVLIIELQISEQTYEDFKSKYLKIVDNVKREVDKESILQDIDFELELMHTDRINVSYIMNLIANLNVNDKKELDNEIRLIKQELDHASDPKLRLKVKLIKGFLDKVAPTLSKDESILDAYTRYEEEVEEQEIVGFAKEIGVSIDMLKTQLATYEYSNLIEQGIIMDELQGSFLKKNKSIKAIKSFIREHTEKYSL